MEDSVYKTAHNPKIDVNPSADKSRIILLRGQKTHVAASTIMLVRLMRRAGSYIPPWFGVQ